MRYQVKFINNYGTWREPRAKHWTTDKELVRKQVAQLKEDRHAENKSIRVYALTDVTKEFWD